MPFPLRKDQNITIAKRCLNADYCMDTLQMATDHYSLGFLIQGDRKCITPTESFEYHKNDVSLMGPYIYHQTLSLSDIPYESYLIKFSPKFVEPFMEEYGAHQFHELYAHRVYHFDEETAACIQQQFSDMEKEYHGMDLHREFILQGMLFRLFDNILRLHTSTNSFKVYTAELSHSMVDALYYIENHYNENPPIASVAQVAGLSVSHFSRTFHQKLGMNYSDYLEDIKLRHVQELLAYTSMSIMEIAAATGYCHGNYLCERFKKATHMSPTEYRKRYR